MTELALVLLGCLVVALSIMVGRMRWRYLHAEKRIPDVAVGSTTVFKTLSQTISDGLLAVDHDGYLLAHNHAAQQLLDDCCADLSQRFLGEWITNFNEFSPQTSPERQYGMSLCEGYARLSFTRLMRDDTQTLFLVRPLSTSDEMLGDIERFKRSQYFAQIGTWDWDVGTDTLYWSEAIYGIFGYEQGEVTPSYEFFYSRVHPDDRELVKAGELKSIETGDIHDVEYRILWPDGTVRWIRETGNYVKNGLGEINKMMGVVRDITDEKASTHQLHRLAHHDVLTGLPNRLMLEQHLQLAIERARNDKTRVALIFIDLNHFKAINDNYGHQVGDRVLVTAATRLTEVKRSGDLVARIGGDEFVMVIEGLFSENSLAQQTKEISRSVFNQFSHPLPSIEPELTIHASLGIAIFPEHGSNIDTLLHAADMAMYNAKRRGDDQYSVAQASLQAHTSPHGDLKQIS
ncbi:diguanylate cyclase domain-containing protein [Shewanella colwelliana]|uniref:diguanylate cyclase domain-containing protein n=1 Tax=Shewanella colwelliana TaxID=23 RepID=UPI003D02FA18